MATVPSLDSSSLNELWSLLLSQEPEKEDLLIVIVRISALKEIAAQEFLKQGFTNHDLCTIIRFVPKLRERTAQELLKHKPTIDDLYCVARYVPQLKAVVWQRLNEQGLTNNDLYKIISELPILRWEAWQNLWARGGEEEIKKVFINVPSLKPQAAERLFKLWPTKSNLSILMRFWPPLRSAAWEKLLELRLNSEDLRSLMRFWPPLRSAAWEKLLELRLNSEDLRSLICDCLNPDEQNQEKPDFKEKIGRELLKHKPTIDDFRFIIEYVPALREEAWLMLSRRMEIIRLKSSDAEEISSARNSLYFFIRDIPELQVSAAKKLLDWEPSINDLYFILKYVPDLREEVFQEILGRTESIPEDNLRLIIREVPAWREEAGIKLLENRRSDLIDFKYVEDWVPTLRREAQALHDFAYGMRREKQAKIDKIIFRMLRIY